MSIIIHVLIIVYAETNWKNKHERKLKLTNLWPIITNEKKICLIKRDGEQGRRPYEVPMGIDEG